MKIQLNTIYISIYLNIKEEGISHIGSPSSFIKCLFKLFHITAKLNYNLKSITLFLRI